MVSLIDHFEYIVCDNEAEALILECNTFLLSFLSNNVHTFNVSGFFDNKYFFKFSIVNPLSIMHRNI